MTNISNQVPLGDKAIPRRSAVRNVPQLRILIVIPCSRQTADRHKQVRAELSTCCQRYSLGSWSEPSDMTNFQSEAKREDCGSSQWRKIFCCLSGPGLIWTALICSNLGEINQSSSLKLNWSILCSEEASTSDQCYRDTVPCDSTDGPDDGMHCRVC